MRVKPHLLDPHKTCSPLREHSLGAGHTGPPLTPKFVLAVLRAFLRARHRRAFQDLSQGPAGLSGSQTQAKAQKNRPILPRVFKGLQGLEAFRGCKGTFQNPPQPLPGLTGLQGFQAKQLQTAPSDSSGALKAPPISLNKEMAISNESG